MKLIAPILVVRDLAASRRFYETVLGQHTIREHGSCVVFDGGIALQAATEWAQELCIHEGDIHYGSHSMGLYFEIDDFDAFVERLKGHPGICVLTEADENPAGKRSIRLCDPDAHVLEFAEA